MIHAWGWMALTFKALDIIQLCMASEGAEVVSEVEGVLELLEVDLVEDAEAKEWEKRTRSETKLTLTGKN